MKLFLQVARIGLLKLEIFEDLSRFFMITPCTIPLPNQLIGILLWSDGIGGQRRGN